MSGVVSERSGPESTASPLRPIRVCLVGPSLDILGGQAIVLEGLRRRLEGVRDIDVSFLPVNPRLTGVLGWLQRVKFVRTVVTSMAYIWSLQRQLRQVDVVHAFSASYWSFLLAPVPAMLVGRLYGKTVVLNYHSGEADDHLAKWRSAVPLARLAHAIVVPSRYLVDVFARHGLHASAIVNFVESDRLSFRPRRAAKPAFLSNRNLESLYNVACSIRAFGHVQHEIPDAELVIAGDGSERESLERLVHELQLRNVRFVGRITPARMPALYEAAEFYLNSPNIDNMPVSIIEAFAAGVPVITTNAGGIPYIVRHEENGLMVAINDDAAMARQALRLIRDPDLAAQLSGGGRKECLEKFVWSAVRDEWIALYRTTASAAAHHASMPQPGAA